jgi:2',3'-cyclic-nucleotide 2'-phosphodiesterase (5'-nucleotidase family)
MAYVAGYIQSVKEKRDDVLVVDAGDVMEKGDLVAYLNQSELTYKTMALAGYDVVVPGNHDDAYGMEQLAKCAALMPDTKFIAANLPSTDEGLAFQGSTIVTINGVRVGIIGIARPNEDAGESEEDLGRLAQKEAKALNSKVDITVVLTHNGSRACRVFSSLAPDVDVFVSGHTHELLKKPIVVESTGALIVQAGEYANYVGRLELKVDLDQNKIIAHEGSLVALVHNSTPINEQVTAMVDAFETELCPEAKSVVGRCGKPISHAQVGKLAAAAFYSLSEADIAFCHPGQIIRDTFPMGDVDVNAVFRTGGQRGHTIVRAQLSGGIIKRYINGLAETDWGQTAYYGVESGDINKLKNAETYEVVMPLKEWETRFLRLNEKSIGGLDRAGPRTAQTYSYVVEPYTFTDAVVAFLTSPTNQELAIEEVATNTSILIDSKIRIVW